MQPVHVGGGAAQVRDHACESRNGVADGFNLADHRILRAALDDASFVLRDGAEGTPAKAAALDGNRKANHVVGRNPRRAVARVRPPRVRQFVHEVHVRGGERNRRRIEPHIEGAVPLHQRPRIAGIRLHVQDSGRVRVQHRIPAHLIEGRQPDDAAFALRVRHVPMEPHHLGGDRARVGGRLHRGPQGLPAAALVGIRIDRRRGRPGRVQFRRIDLHPALGNAAAHECRSADVHEVRDARAVAQALRDIDDLPLRVAEHQQIRLRIRQHAAPHLLGPVIEVGDAPQTRLDAADHDGDALVGFADALGIHDDAAVGPPAADPARRVRVVAAHTPVRGVAVHHRIHVAAGDAEEQPRGPEGLEIGRTVPVRLGDDSDLEALGLQQPADDGHAEARMVHVRIAGDDDDIALTPTKRLHFRARGGQKRRRRAGGGRLGGQ